MPIKEQRRNVEFKSIMPHTAFLYICIVASIIMLCLFAWESLSNKNSPNNKQIHATLNVELTTLRQAYEEASYKELFDEQVLNSRIMYYENCSGWIYFQPEDNAPLACRQSVPWALDEGSCHFPDTDICPDKLDTIY